MSNSFVNYLGTWSSTVQYTGGAPILSLGAPLYLAATAVTYQGVLYITNGSASPTLGLLPNLDSAWTAATGTGSSSGIIEANAASAINVNVANPGTNTFDDVVLTNGQILFLPNQSLAAQNGLYTFNGASSALTRAPSMNTWAQTVGAQILVIAGLQYSGSLWFSTSVPGGTLGTTSLSFSTIPTTPVSIVNGGTGEDTQQAAINALTGTQVSGTYLRSNGTNSTLSMIEAGDVPTLNQNTTGTATNAINLTGATANTIPYQTASSTTGYIATANNSLLATNGTGVPSYTTTLPSTTQVGTGNSLINPANVGFTYNSPTLVWTQNNLPVINNWSIVVFGGGSFVALSNGGVQHSAYSVDNGITWLNSVPTAIQQWYDCDYGDGVFVAVSAIDNVTMYSTDGGATWQAGGNMPVSATWHSVVYSAGLFFAIGTGSENVAVSSNGGGDWSSGSSLGASLSWEALAADQNGTIVAIATGTNQYAYSINNGTSWTLSTLPDNTTWSNLIYGNGYFVAIASAGTVNAYSTDGITWTMGGALPSVATWDSIAYGNGVWVAVAAGSNKSAYSLNHGMSWTASNLPTSQLWYSNAYGNGNFVAISGGGASSVAAYGFYITNPQIYNGNGNNQSFTWNDFANNYLSSTYYPRFIQAGWYPVDGSGAGLTITVNWATFVQIGTLIYVSTQIVYPSTANDNSAIISGLPMLVNVTANGSPQIVPVSVTSNEVNTPLAAQASGSNIAFIVPQTSFTTVKNLQLSGAVLNISAIYSI